MSHAYVCLDPAGDRPTGVGLVVQAAYHLDDLVPLRDHLRAAGVDADLLVPLPPGKPFNRFRSGVRRHKELIATATMRVGSPVATDELAASLAAVVVMNDWGVPRELVERLRSNGRPTFAWVEGAQDFGDVDTGQDRHPYSRVDLVFCLGVYGAEQLAAQTCRIVGSTWLRRIHSAPVSAGPDRRATVNTNFTYGVLTQHRRPWLRSVCSAFREASVPWDLSRHPAERGVAWPVRPSPQPIGELLAKSTYCVGRFSTVNYEALARGVELILHNPHGEREPTFRTPLGAFETTTSAGELAAALARPVRSPEEVRAGAARFLAYHLRLESGPDPAELAAETIVDRLV